MRSLAVFVAVGLLVGACSNAGQNPTAAPPRAPGDAAATAIPSAAAPAPVPCRDAAPTISATAAPAMSDLSRVPGRALFWDAGKLQLFQAGQLQQLDGPFFVRDWSSRLAPDGRVVALLGGERPAEAHLWEWSPAGDQRSVKMPVAIGSDDAVAWAPSLRRVHWGRFAGEEIWVIGLDGTSHRAAFPRAAVYVGAWRTDDELTVVTAPPPRQPGVSGWPIADATFWSWRPPADPVRVDGPVTLTTRPQWSRDGRVLASIEATSTGRAVILRGETTRTLVTERDLATGPDGCAREVEFTGLRWSPDGRTLAVLGRGIGYFVAFVDVGSTARPVIFASPVGPATCYIPPHVEWYGAAAVVPLFGPDCGPTASGRENALALVDPKSGSVMRYVLISRKGFVALSGGWAVSVSGPQGEATEFIALDPQGPRITVPLRRLVDYCCVP